MQANKVGGGRKTNNRNIRRPPSHQVAIDPRQGQPHNPLPSFSMKYFWTHEKCAHEVPEYNNKAPKHQDNATFCNNTKWKYTWIHLTRRADKNNGNEMNNKMNILFGKISKQL